MSVQRRLKWFVLFGMMCGTSTVVSRDLSAQTPPAVKSKPDVVIYEGTYPGWPWIETGADGTMYCVFREGTEHGFSPTGKAMLTKSTDQGKIWSSATVIVDEPGVDDRNVAIVELPTGDLLVTYNTYAQDPATKKMTSQAMTIRSSDQGKTWSQPKVGPVPNSQTKSAPVVLHDGSLVWPFYIAPSSGAVAAISKDQGESWQAVRIPESPEFIGDEWDIVETEPGRLVAIMRNANHSKPAALCISESLDGGYQWTLPRPTNLLTGIFAPANIFVQGDKKTLTVIYPNRRMISVSAARTSDPQRLTWDTGHLLPCYLYRADEARIRDGSYSVSAPAGPNRRLIVDYEIRPESKRITGYFVDFPADW